MQQNSKNTGYVTIAVPFQQHSFRAARGFIEAGIFNKYYTSVYNNEKGIYKVLARVLPNDLVKRMAGRKEALISPYVQSFSKYWGLLYIASGKIGFLKKYSPMIRYKLFRKFGKKVGTHVDANGSKLVLCYDTQAYDIFKQLNKLNSSCIKVLDMASTTAIKIKEIVDAEYKLNHPFSKSLQRHRELYTDEKCNEYLEEMKMADYFLVPSGFVRNSLLELGFQEDKIIDLMHGVDVEQFKPKKIVFEKTKDTIEFLFVGRVEAAKGVYYLLEAFKRLMHEKVHLTVIGDKMGQDHLLNEYAGNVSFEGLKRRDEMPEYYQKADVFILSSLWEGSSLSMLEALASGLPVIASKYSCAPEIITNNEGFVIEPRNIDDIIEKVKWFADNSDQIPKMSASARKLAENYSWNQYGRNIAKIFKELANKSR